MTVVLVTVDIEAEQKSGRRPQPVPARTLQLPSARCAAKPLGSTLLY